MPGLQLYTNAQLTQLQEDANARAEQRTRESQLRNLTVRRAARDAGDTLRGIMADLLGNARRPSLRQLLFERDRARGLGLIVATVALCCLVIDFFLA